jgi:hypothetical protein
MLKIQMQAASKKSFGGDSADVEKALGVKGYYHYKFTAQPFFKPKKSDKVKPVDKDIMAIYTKGPGDDNPDYVFAAEVVKMQKEGYNFNRIPITHIDKSVKFGPFGPYLGRGSTITVDFEVSPYESGVNDGINTYIKGICILHDEPYVEHDREVSTEFAAPIPKKRDASAADENGHTDEPNAKKVKEDETTTTTTEFKTG